MIEYYPQIKALHVTMVQISGGLFALRGAAVLSGARWPMIAPLRYLSYTIDTVLLTAALLLVGMLGLSPTREPWLATKLGALVVYIVLGSLALKRARTRRVKAVCYVAALLCFGFLYSVARAHHPLGALRGLLE
ncbi:MAG TPA: SirB2 family protein [Nannocystis sp.]